MEFLTFPTHMGMPPSRTLREVREASKGAFTPMGWDPSLTLQPLSMLQYFLRKRLHPWRLGSSKAHESNFSLFSRHSFLHLCQPRPLASPCPCPRWPKVTQAGQAPALQHTHIIRGHPVRSIWPLLVPVCDFIKQDIPRASATFHVTCAISKLESRESTSQILSTQGQEFHKFVSLEYPWCAGEVNLPCHPWQGWVTLVMPLTCTILAVRQLQAAPQEEDCLLILEGWTLVPRGSVTDSAASVPGSRSPHHKAMLCHCSSLIHMAETTEASLLWKKILEIASSQNKYKNKQPIQTCNPCPTGKTNSVWVFGQWRFGKASLCVWFQNTGGVL